METVKILNDSTYSDFIESSDKPVLVDFWAPWCGPCKMLSPVIEELAVQYRGKINVAKINVDENQETAAINGIQGIPAVKVFKGGQEVFSQAGAYPKDYWEDEINKLL